MPIYEFKCPSCNLISEEFCHYPDVEHSICKCGVKNTRILSHCSFILGKSFKESQQWTNQLSDSDCENLDSL